ncbi:hypothetical protein M422DRAFT_38510 [Sphaerobolus stellatus SS14]|uniref:Uncharacterized protein n=1 Tax=Sphaerobolus stellatus (strain SS14) TaxID=990650 RepID=A0A0C9U9G8_SPHS4|nr:hypothetical protein M422DRAFT_38510 [Sphaerobolus stellatus SS14]
MDNSGMLSDVASGQISLFALLNDGRAWFSDRPRPSLCWVLCIPTQQLATLGLG